MLQQRGQELNDDGERAQNQRYWERHVANRELGTIETMEANGELHLCFDSGRTIASAPTRISRKMVPSRWRCASRVWLIAIREISEITGRRRWMRPDYCAQAGSRSPEAPEGAQHLDPVEHGGTLFERWRPDAIKRT